MDDSGEESERLGLAGGTYLGRSRKTVLAGC
jgi:hypothetical protein